ncbi:VOC family protein [Alisedimentitalea sp. MJ-SS2]|uniref:VOC family protein n=1 Tax=Aliisedimentitalea sp. MJ-SS2 TaxID=3049795 RepID=UPI00290B6D5F|nr:VOC family protein [Alisedimentitalea sp. MJ-SS2]MDU8927726.1 VOC family protein [Alisedimentitalea sp. MJ-SS2]
MVESGFAVQSLDHLVLTVTDLEATMDFYTRHLGMRPEKFFPADGTTRHALIFGAQKINLHVAGSEYEPKAVAPAPGSADLCFLTDLPVGDWLTYLQANGLKVEEGPVRRTGAQGPILSIYLRDPDGNLIELSNVIGSPESH